MDLIRYGTVVGHVHGAAMVEMVSGRCAQCTETCTGFSYHGPLRVELNLPIGAKIMVRISSTVLTAFAALLFGLPVLTTVIAICLVPTVLSVLLGLFLGVAISMVLGRLGMSTRYLNRNLVFVPLK